MKKCNVCKAEKEPSEFYKNALSKDGLQTRCIICHKKKSIELNKKKRKKSINLVVLENEVYKPIIYNKNYLISNFGNVFVNEHFSTKFIRAKYLKLTTLKTGYYSIAIDKKRYLIHRLVATHFLKKNKNNIVNHIDSNRKNNHFENLEWCTISENIKHGTNKDNYSNKMNRDDVYFILNNKNISTKELAIKFNVSKTNIQLIKNRKIWKHL